MENFSYKSFKDINLNDNFFDSLKSDYTEFSDWFHRKSKQNEYAYVQTIDDNIEGFLYLKIENGPITDVSPTLDCKQAVKIGTMKINPHGTRLGERFIKKSLDFAIMNSIDLIYVTVFSKHDTLINLYEKYGFTVEGTKSSENGTENVLVRRLNINNNDFVKNYPKIGKLRQSYLLSIYPNFHTKLFPDSILCCEDFDIVEDVSHTNSIEKIYICRMKGVRCLNPGDLLVIYRTSDNRGPARFRSVVTSLCTVESVKSLRSFTTFNDLKKHCKNYSVFTEQDLLSFYKSNTEHFVIKMTYNIAFPKRLTRGHLIDSIGLDENAYWGVMELTSNQLNEILSDSLTNINYFF